MEYKAVSLASDVLEGGSIKSIFSVTGNMDSYNDVIERGAFTKTLKEQLPIGSIKVLWQHDKDELPIGTILNMSEIPVSQLPPEMKARFPDATGALLGEWMPAPTQRGQDVANLIRTRALTENSIGFTAVKPEYYSLSGEPMSDGLGLMQWQMGNAKRHLKEVRLYDVSPVNWGANEATMNVKAALPYKETPKAAPDTQWDGPKVMAACDGREQLRLVCAWVDPNGDPETKQAYKLPHHNPNGDVVWNGVRASMGVLMGSMGGVDIPDADRRGVYDHLAKHYAQFDKEPPEFKLLELMALMTEFKAGRMISGVNSDKISAAMDHMMTAHGHLSDIMQAAEPSGKTLTDAQEAARIQAMLVRMDHIARELAVID